MPAFCIVFPVFHICCPRQKQAFTPRPLQPQITPIDSINAECPICFEDDLNYALPCRHGFHDKCIARWLLTKYACPVCRAKPK
jgi:hypothetical protein